MRKTQCLTWGEPRRWCERSLPPHSVIISWEEYETLCGRKDEDPIAPTFNGVGPRPAGVCPNCWVKYKKELAVVEDLWFTDMNDVD